MNFVQSGIMSEKLKISVVGLGRTGWRNHLEMLAKEPERFRIHSVADPMDERLREARETFGCATHRTLESLLAADRPDWVVIGTPTPLHAAQTIAALEVGCHVLCEKPIAPGIAETEAMIAAARKADRYLTVFHHQRYAGDFLKVREILEQGLLGRIRLLKIAVNHFGRRWDWQTLMKNGGGKLNNFGPHFLDQALQLCGPGEPEDLFAQIEKTISAGDADDHAKMVFRGRDGMVVDLELSSIDAWPGDRWKILGTSGGLRGGASRLDWRFFDPAQLPVREVVETPPADRTYDKEEIPWQSGTWEAPADSLPTQRLFFRDLHDRHVQGLAPSVSAEDALRVLRLSEACRKTSPSRNLDAARNP